METFNICGGTLEYIDETHTYLYEGIMLPSVTQILAYKYNDYANVPEYILQRAGERGTAVHKSIEVFNKTGVDDGTQQVHDFRFLQKQYGFEVLDSELPLVIFDNDIPVACGRLDMTFEMDGSVGIADIKTNATLNKAKIAYQLNLYRIGLKQSYNVDAKLLKIIHLRDGKRKFIDVPVIEEMTMELLRQFEERKNND